MIKQGPLSLILLSGLALVSLTNTRLTPYPTRATKQQAPIWPNLTFFDNYEL